MSTVAAISTPVAAGGIGMIRISGEKAVEIAAACFRPTAGKSVAEMSGYTAAYGTVFDESGDVDDGVLIVYRAPKSYTGENVAEICCHGGLLILQKTLRRIYALGAEPAGPGEFTKRAFLNGKLDLAQAEGVMRLISAQGEQALAAARSTLKGAVSKRVESVCQTLVNAAAALAAWADYPEEDIPPVDGGDLAATLESCRSRLLKLVRDYDTGKAVTEGVNTVICGKPNVGKSTLMNLLTGFERSIVTAVPGTTRDVVEETVRVGDVLLRLSDTAGIRDTTDTVERIGVSLAKEKLENADLALLVLDASRPLDGEDRALLDATAGKRRLAILNKADLPKMIDEAEIKKEIPCVVSLSARDPAGIDVLRPALENILGTAGLDFSQELLAGERQRDCCETALRHVCAALDALTAGVTADAVSVDIDCAVEALLTLTGRRASEDMGNAVFAHFCIGK